MVFMVRLFRVLFLILRMTLIVPVLLMQRTVAGRMSVHMAVTVTAIEAAVVATSNSDATVAVSEAQIVVLGIDLRMMGMANLLDDRIETVVLVGSVLNDARCAVRLLKRVSTYFGKQGGEFEMNERGECACYNNNIDCGAIW